MEWIDVKEKLPEPGTVVLLIAVRDFGTSAHYTGYRTDAMFDDGTGWTWRDSHHGDQLGWFTHWQELTVPDPPQEQP